MSSPGFQILYAPKRRRSYGVHKWPSPWAILVAYSARWPSHPQTFLSINDEDVKSKFKVHCHHFLFLMEEPKHCDSYVFRQTEYPCYLTQWNMFLLLVIADVFPLLTTEKWQRFSLFLSFPLHINLCFKTHNTVRWLGQEEKKIKISKYVKTS